MKFLRTIAILILFALPIGCALETSSRRPAPQETPRSSTSRPLDARQTERVRQVMMPLLRADFEVVETYTYEPDAPLDCPITVLGGLQDLEVPRESLEAWREQTTAAFSLRILQGDHFFVNTAQTFIYRILTDELYKHLTTIR